TRITATCATPESEKHEAANSSRVFLANACAARASTGKPPSVSSKFTARVSVSTRSEHTKHQRGVPFDDPRPRLHCFKCLLATDKRGYNTHHPATNQEAKAMLIRDV